jgi:F-type H+-transporting ATPase subunit epsilon
MAYRFELVSPERRLAAKEVRTVRLPGADGDMTAGEGHGATITTLRPGVVVIEAEGGEETYAVTGGFAEVSAEGVTVLAEQASLRGELTQETYSGWMAEARKRQDEAPEDGVDSAAKLVADMVAMGGHIGLDPNQPSL